MKRNTKDVFLAVEKASWIKRYLEVERMYFCLDSSYFFSDKYLLSIYYVPASFLSAKVTAAKITDLSLFPTVAFIPI
jgi:hypothetical protein